MKILLVYPRNPDTYWSFRHALKFTGKKAVNPPLGLLTVSSILPPDWEKKLVDLNITPLQDSDIKAADLVFVSAMSVQQASVDIIIERCNSLNVPLVAGGPLFTEEPESYPGVDHLVLNEAEITLPQFIRDFENSCAQRIYQTDNYPGLSKSPIPDYSLINPAEYDTLSLQYSRGCPFQCEFCDITALYGHRVRTKSTSQILEELENIFSIGWRGHVFFVDDNFIGNRHKLKNDLLPAVIKWMQEHNNPYNFITEASIDLADDPQLIGMMVEAGFVKAFIGIETPEEASLAGCNKTQNSNRNLIDSVKIIQSAGIEVAGGFIVGFDHDTPSVFERQIEFIQNSGIITAMVGLLNAPKKTMLYKRLLKENRITEGFSGDNTNYSMNFMPKMNKELLLKGYKHLIQGIYASKPYYERTLSFLKSYTPPLHSRTPFSLSRFLAFLKSVFVIGISSRGRKYYWKLIFWSLIRKPEVFPMAVTYSIYGYHFRKIFNN